MEPIPLSGGQLILTDPEDHILLARDPSLIAGALAANVQDLEKMRITCPEVPVGLAVSCPPLPKDQPFPMTEQYIAACRTQFKPFMQYKPAFFYLYGAEHFRALRAAVLAMTDLSGSALMAQLPVDADGRMEDGTSSLAAIAVLQRIGVSTIVLTAEEPEDLTETLHSAAPYARVSLGVRCPAVWLLRDLDLPNVEFFLPVKNERVLRLADLVRRRTQQMDRPMVSRDLADDVVLAPDGRDIHFINWTTSISDEIPCDHALGQRLIELEDDAPAAFKLLLEEEEDVLTLEEDLYMITRPVCICAESPELLEKALRVYAGLALYDGTWEQEDRILKYFAEKYGLICM